MRGGETVEVEPAELAPLRAEPEAIPLEILYEDKDVVAVEQAGGNGGPCGRGLPVGDAGERVAGPFRSVVRSGGELRPGIVHRLDRYTSGVILVARNDAAHRHLAEQFAGRKVEKVYLALVHGVVKAEKGKIDKPIARDPVRRMKMTARLGRGEQRSPNTVFSSGTGPSPFSKCASARGELTRSECIWPASVTRSRATGFTERRQVWKGGRPWTVSSCTLSGSVSCSPRRGRRRRSKRPCPAELEAWMNGLL